MNESKTSRQRKQSLTRNSRQNLRHVQSRSKSTVSFQKKTSAGLDTPIDSYLIGWGNISFCPPLDHYKKIAKNVLKYSIGDNHLIYMNQKHQIFGLGQNNYGQLGFAGQDVLLGTGISLMSNYIIQDIYCTPYCTFLITDKKQLYGCGFNSRGQLGLGHNTDVFKPTLIEKMSHGQCQQNQIKKCSQKSRIKSISQNNPLADRTNNYLQQRLSTRQAKSQNQISTLLGENQQIIQICGGAFHSIVLTNLGKIYYTGNLYRKQSLKRNQFITIFTQLFMGKKVIKIKSGLTSFGMINSQDKLYVMGIVSPSIICDQPTQLPISNIIDFAITQKYLYSITHNGQVYQTDITKTHLKTIKIQFGDRIKQIQSSVDYTLFITIKNAIYGVGDNSDSVLFENCGKYIHKPTLMNTQRKIKFIQIKCSPKFAIGISDKYPQQLDNNLTVQSSKQIQILQKQNAILRQLLQQKKSTKTIKIQTQKQQKQIQKNYRTFDSSLEIPFEQIQLEKHISQGGYGIIYRAKWRKTTVAVKIFKIDQKNSNSIRDFTSQCKAMEVLRHPNIVMFLGVCTKSPNFAIVLEYCQGGTLWSLLQGNSQISWQQRRSFSLDIAKGMNYLHSRKVPILHRDLKSLNLLLDQNNRIKLADFGWTKGLQNYMTGKIGTYQWMAPQVISAEQYTEKADVFSYGIILWEIASRQPPYRNVPGAQVAYDVLHKDLRPTIPKKTPEAFSNLMRRCWIKNPSLRPCFNQIIQELQSMKL